MDNKFYIEVIFKGVRSEEENDLIDLLHEFHCLGTSENLAYTQKSLSFDAEVMEVKTKTVHAFFFELPQRELFLKLESQFPHISFKVHQKPVQDWLAEWRKNYHAFPLVEDIWVVPSWESHQFSPEQAIIINPGMAFGTGTHSTTKMAAKLLYQTLADYRKKSKVQDISLLDVGTGTGILIFLATKVGVSLALGLDIDPEAVRVAQENNLKNPSSSLVFFENTPIETIKDSFDLVCANIVDHILIRLKKDFERVTKNYLILSGILVENEENVLKSYENSPFKLLKRLESNDGWVAILFKRIT